MSVMTVTYSLKPEDHHIAASWLNGRRKFSVARLFQLLIVPCLLGIIIGLVRHDVSEGLIGGGISYFVLIRFPRMFAAAKLMRTTSKGANSVESPIELTIMAEGIEMSDPNVFVKIGWGALAGIIDLLKYIVFDASDQCWFVPKRAFESAPAAQQFLEAARRFHQAAPDGARTTDSIGTWPPAPNLP